MQVNRNPKLNAGRSVQFVGPDADIHVISRILLRRGNGYVLCRVKGADWYFLPGGHVETGESAREALQRELMEELGIVDDIDTTFMGLCENIFSIGNEYSQHEINVIFYGTALATTKILSRESKIEFRIIGAKSFREIKLYPAKLHIAILEWLNSKGPFFIGI